MKAALLGYGTVGKGVDAIWKAEGLKDLELTKILVRRKEAMEDERFTLDFDSIISDENINVVIEAMGGEEPAYSYVKESLEAGKHVISANKKMLARHMDLFETAEKHDVKLLVEASCGGGIPWFSNMESLRRSDHIESFKGIMNGTSNFILSSVFEEGRSFDGALEQAKKLGYAEADPSDDLCGYDVSFKTVLSVYKAFDRMIDVNEMVIFGIERLGKEDIDFARSKGRVIKLIGQASLKEEKLEACVFPVFMKDDDLFAKVSGNFNIFECDCKHLGKLHFIGQGAGSYPTGQAIVQDLLDLRDKRSYGRRKSKKAKLNNEKQGTYYIRGNCDALKDLIEERIGEDRFLSKRIGLNQLIDHRKDIDFIATYED